ncbi:MAG: hypothetical protein CO093_05825 [Alphaproteobacteria bacterium CG_4_9_14_3_um_filter_47_13]|nr:MAG: hypothetical protein CO093_05825 [Alphaproteobacteria bacterium CG_4_9_14_3_um_filter_47_13]
MGIAKKMTDEQAEYYSQKLLQCVIKCEKLVEAFNKASGGMPEGLARAIRVALFRDDIDQIDSDFLSLEDEMKNAGFEEQWSAVMEKNGVGDRLRNVLAAAYEPGVK